MVARKQVKSLESLPDAIHWLEKSMKFYEATMAVKFREEIRLPHVAKPAAGRLAGGLPAQVHGGPT